jgi:thiol-disulfide isomerase/thioredoxin
VHRTACAVAAAAVLVAGCSSPFAASESSGGFVSGDGSITVLDAKDREPLKELSGQTLEGELLSTEQFAGKVLVLNVWGSWCAPCRIEASHLQAASTALGEDVQFIGIAIRDQLTSARRFQDDKGITYPSIFDPDSSTLLEMPSALYPVATPTTYVVDARGRVAVRILRDTTESTLTGLVEDVLAESGSP